MRFSKKFKPTLYTSLLALYASGVILWILQKFFLRDRGIGLEPPAATATVLHLHSIIGLWFLLVFGYLFRSHMEVGWRAKEKRMSGGFLAAIFGVLILTVPGLFYLTNEQQKAAVSFLHTYLGLFLIAPYLFHYFTKRKSRGARSRN